MSTQVAANRTFLRLARFGAWRPFDRLYLLPAVAVQAMFLLTFINDVWVS